jgi:hypothetical protein
MNCNEAFQGILEAEANELQAAGETPLGRHIRDCPKCAAMAERVLRDQEALSRALVEEVAPPDLDALLARAAESEPGLRVPGSKRIKRLGFAVLPLAAAAGMAALLLSADPPLPGDSYLPPAQVAGLDLEVPEGTDVAVLATRNPDITVLWFF